MKRVIPCLLMFSLLVCVCFGSLADDEETSDNLLGENEYADSVSLEGSEILTVNGGGANLIDAWNSSQIKIISTSLPLELDKGGVYDIHLGDDSSLLFSGGATESIRLYDDSTAELRGGTINYITIYHRPVDSCEVTIYCQEGYTKTDSYISGLWADGTSFYISFCNPSYCTTADYVNVVVIPEPTTLALLGLGGLLIRRKK